MATARRLTTLLVVVVLATAVACVVPMWWARVRPIGPTPVDASRVAAARAAVLQLRVTEPLEIDGYRREFFGDAWADVDGNGCDTRNDVLGAWLTDVVRDALRPCLVVSGTLRDPYTGHLVDFVRGPATSAQVQIDHVVALADAWRKGAADWPSALALEFANDPANLVPTSAAPNQDKSASDASRWLPPNQGYHCAYAVQQVLVKAAYGLGITSEEFAALGDALATCPAAPDAAAAMSAVGVSLGPEHEIPGPGTGAETSSTSAAEGGGRVRTPGRRGLLGDRSDRRADLRVRPPPPPRRGLGAVRAARGPRPGARARGRSRQRARGPGAGAVPGALR